MSAFEVVKTIYYYIFFFLSGVCKNHFPELQTMQDLWQGFSFLDSKFRHTSDT